MRQEKEKEKKKQEKKEGRKKKRKEGRKERIFTLSYEKENFQSVINQFKK